MFSEIIIYAGVFIAAYTGVEIFRRWSLRREIFDLPNERSLHVQPTPRGGGLIIVFISLSFYLFYALFFGGRFSRHYFAGAILIAFISWLDDLYSVSILWRFAVQAAAALLIVFALFSDVNFSAPDAESIKILKSILIFFWIVWLTNAYNFMDGIDGLAGFQAVTAGIGWSLAGVISQNSALELYGGVIAFSSLGFLIQNWQPAKVFMGDVGSAFLGYSFAVLPFLAAREDDKGYIKWVFVGVALLWVFIFDTIFTLLRRILKREKIWLPHRTHIYQRLVVAGLSHRTVTIVYGILSAITGLLVVLRLLDANYERLLLTVVFLESILLILLPIFFIGKYKAAGVNKKL